MNDWNVWILKTKYRIHGRYVGLESPKPRSYPKATLGPLLHSVHGITWRKLEERKRGRELASSCVCPISVSNSQWWHLTLSRNSWSSSGSGWQFHSKTTFLVSLRYVSTRWPVPLTRVVGPASTFLKFHSDPTSEVWLPAQVPFSKTLRNQPLPFCTPWLDRGYLFSNTWLIIIYIKFSFKNNWYCSCFLTRLWFISFTVFSKT